MTSAPQLMWVEQQTRTPDVHVALRGTFELGQDAAVEIRALGSSWFVLWIDEEFLMEGPLRFVPAHPEYDLCRKMLKAGKHVIAVHLHDEGISTRMLPDMPPFLWCRALVKHVEIPVRWKCSSLAGHASQVRRINVQLGWSEWWNTRIDPADWREVSFDDSKWNEVVAAKIELGPIKSPSIAPVQLIGHKMKAIAQGQCADAFGYERDDPPTRFFLRDLECKNLPPAGIWKRYDLGRVRLGRARLVLDVPAGTIVEIAAAEQLRHGRVAPFITLSGSESCNMDHFVARGGKQEFFPLTPKGGRYIEVHVLGDPAKIQFVEELYAERTYHGAIDGSFECDDDLLNRIWMTGVETYRACSEDAIIDNPTRERGQWVGDALVGGMIASVAFPDLRLMRRNLVQTAQCARVDGLVPGMTTGGLIFIASYALIWVVACFEYFKITGDRDLLANLFDAARKNMDAFEPHIHPDGLDEGLADSFIDWGFVRGDAPINVPLNLHYRAALAAMMGWCRALDKMDHFDHYARREVEIESAVKKIVDTHALEKLGYHACAMALLHGVFDPHPASQCVAYLKKHMLSCFPNDPAAPRLSDPGFRSPRLITPYFAHFVMPALIERGEIEFVLDQYRACWGWALKDDRTTWLEVFDTRWSHCHQWSGSPTWQLSRYLTGLHPRFDLGENHFDFRPIRSSLKKITCKIPLPRGFVTVQIDGSHYHLNSPPLTLHPANGEPIEVQNQYDTSL